MISIVIFFFVIMLLGLVMSVGMFGNVYFDGFNELFFYGIKVGFVVIIMIILLYLICYFFKLNNEFIKNLFRVICIGIIILLLVKGVLNYFSEFSKDS